jgi:hypothetical protein
MERTCKFPKTQPKAMKSDLMTTGLSAHWSREVWSFSEFRSDCRQPRPVQIRFFKGTRKASWSQAKQQVHPLTTPTCATPLPLSSRPKRSVVEGSAVRPAALSNPSGRGPEQRIHNQTPTPNPISQCRVATLLGPTKSTPQNRPTS